MQEAWKKRISHGVPVYGTIQKYYEGSELTFWTVLYKMTLITLILSHKKINL